MDQLRPAPDAHAAAVLVWTRWTEIPPELALLSPDERGDCALCGADIAIDPVKRREAKRTYRYGALRDICSECARNFYGWEPRTVDRRPAHERKPKPEPLFAPRG